MIEWVEIATGIYGVRSDGRALCSLRDPVKEARQWCDHHAFVSRFPEVSIVGIGAGHHLIELAARFPNLRIRAFDAKALLFETQPEIVAEALRTLSANVELLTGLNATRFATEKVPMGPTVRFAAACAEEEEKIYDLLLGQSPATFAEWSRLLGYQNLLNGLRGIGDDLAVNIKTLNDSFCDGSLPETKALRALKELVE